MNNNRFFWGILLLAFGLVFLIDQLGVISGFDISLWRLIEITWPLIVIYFGAKLLVEKKTTGGLIVTAIGLLFLGSGVFEINAFPLLWPIAIIGLAVFLMLDRKVDVGNLNTMSSSTGDSDYINEDIVFWGMDRAIKSKAFKGGKIDCVFGGGQLDLRDAKIAKDGAVLEINCVFGGFEVIVPRDANVITSGTGVFGGWSPKFRSEKASGPVLEIKGTAVFGGVEIRD